MTQNKKIEFTTTADTKGLDALVDKFKKVGTVVDDVISKLKKVKLGSGGRSDDLAVAVKNTTNEMGKLRVESAKTADTLSDRIGKAVLRNTQHLQQQTKEFQHATRAARDLSSATSIGAMAGVAAGLGAGGAGSLGSARGVSAVMAANQGPYGMPGGGGNRGGSGGAPPGATGRWGAYANNPWNNMFRMHYGNAGFDQNIATAQSTIGAAQGANDVFGRFGKFESDTSMMGLNNLARSQSYRQDLYRLGTSAPVGYGAYLMGRGTAFSSGESGSAQDATMDAATGEAGGVSRDRVGTNASIVGDRANMYMRGRGKSAAADMAGGVLSGVGTALDAVGDIKDMKFGSAGKKLVGGTKDAFSTATMATNLRSGAMNAEQSEAMSSTLNTIQRIYGPQLQQAFGSIQGHAGILAGSSRMLGGMGRQGMAMGAGSGYDVGSSAATLGQLGQQFGTRATMEGGLGQSAFAMSRKGMDAGVAGGIMGQIGMAGGDGQQVMERIFAKGIKSGMNELDMRFFEKIGTAVAENSITASGSVSGGNLPEALMFGLKKGSTMADVQGNVSGMQMANQMATGNSFFSSRSMALASQALGADASGVSIQALNETSPTDLMADKNEYLDNLGIDKKKRQEFGRQRLNMFGDVLAGGAAGDGKEAKRIRAGIDKYGDFSTYMNKAGQKERDFVGAVGKSTFGGGDYDTFQGMMNFIGGSKQRAGKGGGSGLQDVVDGQAITNIATQTQLIFKQFENVNKILGDIVKGSNGAVKNIGEAYSVLAKATVEMTGQTMGVGSENYNSSMDAAMATAGAAGGMGKVAEASDKLAESLSRLHGVTLTAITNGRRLVTAPPKVKPRTGPGQ